LRGFVSESSTTFDPRLMSKTSELSGVAAMLGATASFVICDTFMKLAAENLPPFEVLFLRGIAASLSCAVLVVLRGEWHAISGIRNPRALLRAVAETFSVLCYIVALARMPIADVIAIVQTAPLILILGVAFLVREKIGAARVVLVLLGFVGALMVAQPDASGISPAALLAFASALLIAARDLIGRDVPTAIPVTVVALATNLMVMAAAAAMSLGVETWTPPTARHISFLAIAGLLVTLAHAGLLLAYRLGRTTVIAPFFYSFAPWALLSGLIVWGALPNPLALAGILLICISGVASVLLDQRWRRAAVPSTDARVRVRL
jgi:drug/metabolite transporter (DMT)-like permease